MQDISNLHQNEFCANKIYTPLRVLKYNKNKNIKPTENQMGFKVIISFGLKILQNKNVNIKK